MATARKKPPIQRHPTRSVNRTAYVAGIVAAVVVVAAVAALAWWQPVKLSLPFLSAGPQAQFATFGPIFVSSEGYAFNASLALQTSGEDARWAKKNKETLDLLIKQSLNEIDPKTLSSPAGLVAAQQKLAAKINARFDQPRVQQVLFTDFVMQAD